MTALTQDERYSLIAAILIRQYPDYREWPRDRQEKAAQDLWNEALDAGLKGIMDTIQMLDDMAKEGGQ